MKRMPQLPYLLMLAFAVMGTESWAKPTPESEEDKELAKLAQQAVVKKGYADATEAGWIVKTKKGVNVLVWRLPKVPGGHYLVMMRKDGTVEEIVPGK